MRQRLDLSSAAFAGFSVLYPVIAIVLIRAAGPGAALVLLLVVLAARIALPALQSVPMSIGLALLPVLAAVAAVGVFDRPLAIRLYPVFMNVAMLSVFAVTLWRPPSMIERFARILAPDLPQSGVRYTYKVTIVWVVFFALNGAVALWSALQPGWTVWTLYNGFLSYVAAGALFLGEFLVRRHMLRQRSP
jgi:uncharacterized membrane protein